MRFNKFEKSLEEDSRKRIQNEPTRFIELIEDEEVFKEIKDKLGTEQHFVVYGYFKEELNFNNEIQFEVIRIYPNATLGSSSLSYYFGKILEIDLLILIIEIFIRNLICNKLRHAKK